MDKISALVVTILQTTKQQGLGQHIVANLAGMTPQSLSRMKKPGANPTAESLSGLASTAGLSLGLIDQNGQAVALSCEKINQMLPTFRQRYAHLVWSNPDASDDIYLRRAILSAQFDILLDAANEFGYARVWQEWLTLLEAESPEAIHLKERIEPTLRSIQDGFIKAEARYRAAMEGSSRQSAS